MEETKNSTELNQPGTLENTDMPESLRQLRWTIAVTVIGLAVVAWIYL